jgi:hypothetical protein
MNCTVPANQPIYQALLDKAASYPADKPYQAKAYNNAAQIVAAMKDSAYKMRQTYGTSWVTICTSIGYKIEMFINEFIKTNPEPAKPVEPATQSPAKPVEMPAVPAAPTWPWTSYVPSYIKPVVYNAENPRRSRRLANKPTPKYFTEEDEQDEIAEAIEAVCAKKGYEYSDELVSEFNAWLPTADWATKKYDWRTDKYETRTKPDTAKEWAMYYSTSLQEQQKQKKLSKAIVKYCEKNNIEYSPLMDKKFSEWKADPANKKLVTYTYNSYSYGCACGSCDPTGTKMANVTEYSYERGATYCINKWFSTLKKTVVF